MVIFVKLAGKVWPVRYCKLGRQRAWGECDSPEKRNHEIRIDERLTGLKRLEITLHELMHADDFDIPENVVKHKARRLAKALSQLGFVHRSEIE
jgi:hypothetical protein